MISNIIFYGLMCMLQYLLSGRKSRIPGLILPALNLIFSVIVILSFAAFSYVGTSYSATTVEYAMVEDANGNVLSITEETEAIDSLPAVEESSVGILGGADGPTSIFVAGPQSLLPVVGVFLLTNIIPTALYLTIYFLVRRSKKRSTVDKTLVQDL